MESTNSLIYQYLCSDNEYYIMREDLLPFSFGGNKYRKNINYFKEVILKHDYDHVVTYGSKHSNHARIVANLCARYNLKCIIITPETNQGDTFNNIINEYLNASVVTSPLNNIKQCIDKTLSCLKKDNKRPYFIPGGAHGLLGTKAYVDATQEIIDYEEINNIKFDYIFLASGTGATQAGLVVGNHIQGNDKNVIGISIARNIARGTEVIEKSVKEYLIEYNLDLATPRIDFIDAYTCGGYGLYNNEIKDYIKKYFYDFGIPLDTTYTGKAVYGMHEYLNSKKIKSKNILFIHTGGGPLFFDYLGDEI